MLLVIILSVMVSMLVVVSVTSCNLLNMQNNMRKVEIPYFKGLITEALTNLGYSTSEADITSETLLYAELRGNNQGIVKLLSGALKPDINASNITIVRETAVSALIDGGRRIGMAVLETASDCAINKTKVSGMAVIGASNYSSPTGAIGFWARKIAKAGYIGIVMSQCSELVAPFGSYEAIFGTNPIAIGIPTKEGKLPIILDMATSAAANFSLVIAAREGKNISNDIAYNHYGKSTTDPYEAIHGCIRAFGGIKGSGLALMVELLAGALTGADMIDKKKKGSSWGSLIIAIDPSLLGSTDEFLTRVDIMTNRVKHAKTLEDVSEVFLPGERGDRMETEAIYNGYLSISETNLADLINLGNKK